MRHNKSVLSGCLGLDRASKQNQLWILKALLLAGALAVSGCNDVHLPMKSEQLASWFHGGFAGKKIVYWGNSTVSNAYQMFEDLGAQTGSYGLLRGLEYRSDMEQVESDGNGNVTVTLSAPVTYVRGQWVSLRFADPQLDNVYWAPSVKIESVQGNAFTYSLPNAPALGVTEAQGTVTGSILNFGNNGATLAAMLGGAPYPASLVCAEKPDLLIIRGPLINDVRLGLTDLEKATALERQMLDMFEKCVPHAAILLTTENSLLTTDTGQHWVQPNSDAQSYTNILHDAVMSMKGGYPNVDVIDVMAEVYGTTSPASSPLMANQLHPSAAGQNVEAGVLLRAIGSL